MNHFKALLKKSRRYNLPRRPCNCRGRLGTDSTKAMYDVAIIGLGPAGSTLARLLNKNMRVVAIDKKSPEKDNGFTKPCGGLLAPDAQRSISRLGLTLPKELLVSPLIFVVKTIDLKRRLLRNYQRFYININRHKFDMWLMSLIPPSVNVITDSVCVKIKKTGSGYIVYYRKAGAVHSVTAKYVVGADGANSVVRKSLFPKAGIRKYIAVQQWFSDTNERPFYSSLFDESITDCYCWSISKDGLFIIGGAFPVGFAKKGFNALKKKAAEWGFKFDSPVKTECCMVLRPKSPFCILTGKDGAFFLGEAAGFISPSSLEGVSYALDSALILAKALNEKGKNPNNKYSNRTLGLKVKIGIKNIKSLFIYTPLLRKAVMLSGIQSFDIPD